MGIKDIKWETGSPRVARHMRIAIVGPMFPPDIGAGSTQLYNYAKGLQERGHRVDVVTAAPYYPDGAVPRRYLKRVFTRTMLETLPLIRVWMPPLRSAGFVRRVVLSTFFSVLSFFALFAVRPLDVVYGAGAISPSPFDIPLVLHCRVRGVPFVIIENDSVPETIKALSPTLERFVRLLRGVSTFVEANVSGITTYTSSIGRIIEARGIPADRVHMVPLPVDTETFKPTPHVPHEKALAIYSGNIGVLYDFETLLEAASILDGEVDFIIRGDGERKDWVRQKIAEKRLSNVLLLGKVGSYREVMDVVSKADIAVVPMRRIPIWTDVAVPTKVFEFIACGLPLVCAGGLECRREIVGNRVGIVVEPGDGRALAEAIREMAGNSALRQDISRRARLLALEKFSRGRVCENLEAVFRDIRAKRGRGDQ